MKRITLLLTVCFLLQQASATLREVEIITEGDRSLALDWAYPLKAGGSASVDYMVTDNDGNVYFGGHYQQYLTFPDGTRLDRKDYNDGVNSYLAKFSKEGTLLWTVHLRGEGNEDIQGLKFSPAGDLLCQLNVGLNYGGSIETGTFYYNEMPLYQLKRTDYGFPLLLKIDPETGALSDYVKIRTNNSSSSGYGCSLDIAGNIYICGVIDESFTGMDSDRLPTNVRTHGLEDMYIAKISPDFKLQWDYAIGGEYRDYGGVPEDYYMELYDKGMILYPYPYGVGGASFIFNIADTMFVKCSFFSDSINISLDPANPLYVKRPFSLFMEPNFCFFAKYDMSGAVPKLLDYRVGDTNDYPFFVEVYNGNKIVAEDVNKQSSVLPVNFYHFDTQFNMWKEEELYQYKIQAAGWAGNVPFRYDAENNFIISSRMSFNLPPLEATFSEKTGYYSFPTDESQVNCLAKYDTLNNFCWAAVFRNMPLLSNAVDPYSGSMYVGVYNFYQHTDLHLDWDPDPAKTVDLTDPSIPAIIARYVETYRIKAAAGIFDGSVMVSDTFVRHGGTARFQVLPAPGYETVSVSAGGKELHPVDGNGNYEFPDVTAPVEISAAFRSMSGVSETAQGRFSLYPNPAKETLFIQSGCPVRRVAVRNMQGSVLIENRDQQEIDIRSLPAGTYYLQAETEEGTQRGLFIRQ